MQPNNNVSLKLGQLWPVSEVSVYFYVHDLKWGAKLRKGHISKILLGSRIKIPLNKKEFKKNGFFGPGLHLYLGQFAPASKQSKVFTW